MDENYGMLKKGLIVLAIPFVIQLVFLGILLKSQIDNAEHQRLAIHTKDVIGETESLTRRLVMLRNNLLGLAMSGDVEHNPFDPLVTQIDEHLVKLDRLVSDNQEQKERITRIVPQIHEYVAWVGDTHRLLRAGQQDAGMARIKTQAGKIKLDAIQDTLYVFRSQEERLDVDRQASVTRSGRTMLRSIVLGSIVTMVLAGVLVVLYSRAFARRVMALAENARRYAEGKPLVERVTGRDEIGQLAQTFENMARSLDARGRENEMFIYSVSHDLRSPLVNLQGFSRELSSSSAELRALFATLDIPDSARAKIERTIEVDIKESVHFIQTAVTRLSAIIDSLLRLSRAGRVDYRMEVLNMNNLVERVVEAQAGQTSDRGATIEVGDLPPAWGDPTAVEQVVSNLLTNAVKYLDPARPGQIEVGGEMSGGDGDASVLYHVRDNGLGIPEAQLSKLFIAFQRLHPGVAQGEGVGLALVRSMVERHSGKIWAESQPGTGTTFFFTLPAVSREFESSAKSKVKL